MGINMTTTTITTCKIIDIHSHILHNMDHGSSSLESSIEMLNMAKNIGITDIICTVHYHYKNNEYMDNFKTLKKYAKNLNINLYIGNEILINDSTLDEIINNRVLSLNNKNYLLLEVKRRNQLTIDEIIKYIKTIQENGYKVIIAHPELIKKTFKKKKDLMILRKLGVLFQIDAYSYYKDFKTKIYIKKLIKLNMVDFIASDMHENTKNYYHFKNLYKLLKKKYGIKFANKLYYENPKKVLYGKKIK